MMMQGIYNTARDAVDDHPPLPAEIIIFSSSPARQLSFVWFFVESLLQIWSKREVTQVLGITEIKQNGQTD